MGNRWISFGSAKNNEQYIECLLKRLGVSDYNFCVNGYGDYDLYATVGLNTFKVAINELEQKLELYQKRSYRKAQKQSKEYFTLIHKEGGLDCWLNTLKHIVA